MVLFQKGPNYIREFKEPTPIWVGIILAPLRTEQKKGILNGRWGN